MAFPPPTPMCVYSHGVKSHIFHFPCKHTHTHACQLASKYSRTVCNDCTCQARCCCMELHLQHRGQREFPVTSDKWRRQWTGRRGLSNLSLPKQILIQPAGLSAGSSPHSFWIPSFLPFFPLIASKIMKGQLCSISLVKCKNFGGM